MDASNSVIPENRLCRNGLASPSHRGRIPVPEVRRDKSPFYSPFGKGGIEGGFRRLLRLSRNDMVNWLLFQIATQSPSPESTIPIHLDSCFPSCVTIQTKPYICNVIASPSGTGRTAGGSGGVPWSFSSPKIGDRGRVDEHTPNPDMH